VEKLAPVPQTTARVRRLRLYRLLGNAGWILAALVLLPLVLGRLFPKISDLSVFIWLPSGLLLLVLMLPWLLVLWGFQYGAIKCPSCRLPFALRSTTWIPKSCQNCGYDIYTLQSRGDF
jgi:hypothetical protein